ncbi:MAG: nucleotide sugar dehydrogenase [Nitrososphaerota archaeon]|nr:nucleotide sugar dehydrogenase [Nitrososphaerota archaeon]
MMSKEGLLQLRTEEVKSLYAQRKVTICTVGMGRIGLPTAAMFAAAGANVIGVDISPQVVLNVNDGVCKFVDEPGLDKIIEEPVRTGKLRATTDFASAIPQSDFVIVCVPTPVDHVKTPDYSAVTVACKTIGKLLKSGMVVIIESTVGPGTVENLIRPILESESGMSAGSEFGLASCPERSDPGNIVGNMKTVPRIVGGINQHTTDIVADLYETLLNVKVYKVSDPKTANAVKLTENLFRDVNIALANEFALVFEKLGIDTLEVIKACATKYNFMPHYPGVGVGGPCLPSNSYYLISEGVKAGHIPSLVRMAREINDRMPEHVTELVSEALNEVGKTIRGSKIAVLGVAYKPEIKDVQLTPMEHVCNNLSRLGAMLDIYDPMFPGESVFGYQSRRSLSQAVNGADCLVIGTAHKEFQKLDLKLLAQLAESPAAFVDARNVVNPKEVLAAGFSFRGVGRRVSMESI